MHPKSASALCATYSNRECKFRTAFALEVGNEIRSRVNFRSMKQKERLL